LQNDKMDIAQVEGLGDLLSAETEAQRVQAMRLMQGALGDRAAEWRASLLTALALVEVTIDFADEEVPTDVSPEVSEKLKKRFLIWNGGRSPDRKSRNVCGTDSRLRSSVRRTPGNRPF
jgi:tRNA U34 5-carboxymethylaminomethyl modifying GTPase MnmE/TrmE